MSTHTKHTDFEYARAGVKWLKGARIAFLRCQVYHPRSAHIHETTHTGGRAGDSTALVDTRRNPRPVAPRLGRHLRLSIDTGTAMT
jgi:hypothetical protein